MNIRFRCGVAMTVCETCKAVGYHGILCPDSDETMALATVRLEMADLFQRSDLGSYAHAIDRCDLELLAAIRSLNFSGRDDLSDLELCQLFAILRPTLRRIASEMFEVGP